MTQGQGGAVGGGVLAMLAAMAFMATQDTMVKLMLVTVSPVAYLWCRNVLQLILAAQALRRSGRPWRPTRGGLHGLRGALVLGASWCGVQGLRFLPVAEFTAIYCLVPVLVVAAAHLFLREAMGRSHWACLALSLLGSVLLARPGTGLNPQGTAWALGGVACYTGFHLITRVLARNDSAPHIQLTSSALAVAVLSVALPGAWPAELSVSQWAFFALAVAIGSQGQYLMVIAYARAPATVVSPYLYSAIVFSAGLGWLVFSHWPDALALMGMGLIAMAGLAAAALQARATSAGARS